MLETLRNRIHWCRRDERGASAVEYGLLITGIATVIAIAVFAFGGSVVGLFGDTCDTVADTRGTGDCATD